MMKCENCGATLQIDELKQVKFCPYCGAEIEIEQEAPTTMAGAVHEIARSFFRQSADNIRYKREHAAEIAEQKREERKEEARNNRKTMIVMMAGLVAMLSAMMLVGKVIGWA